MIIKIKNGEDLKCLLAHPIHLSAFIRIGILSRRGAVRLSQLRMEYDERVVKDLKFWGYIEIQHNSIITLKKPSILEVPLPRKVEKDKLLSEVLEEEVPSREFLYYKMAIAFQKLFIKNIELLNAKVPKYLLEAKYKKWLTDTRLLYTKDGNSIGDMRKVFHFLDGHDFWAGKILTIDKLRKQIPNLLIQIAEHERDSKKQSGGVRTSAEYMQKVLSEFSSNKSD